MTRNSPHLPLVAALALVFSAGASPRPASAEDSECAEHGTSVVFYGSPAKAAKAALEEEKLVFVLHVSGNFETPDYT